MKKLRTMIHYECATSFKYIWVFYGIMFSIVALISFLIYLSVGNPDGIGTNGMEINSMVYIGIMGVLGFKEDFKMLIQNGFTRKYIFLSTLSLFAFTSGIMALVDTIVGNGLHLLSHSYDSLFGAMYGYEHPILLNWLWLFLSYLAICSLFYLLALIINKIGKTASVFFGVSLGLILLLLIPALFLRVLSRETVDKVIEAICKAYGFMADGTISLLNPILLFIVIAGILSSLAYLVIRRTELKG